MRLLTTLSAMPLTVLGTCTADRQPEWENIFDGETLEGWTPKITGEAAGVDRLETFRAEDGVLRVDYNNYEVFDGRFGVLFFERELRDYRLRFEYRFYGEQLRDAPDWAFMNSGVMLHSQSAESMVLDADAPVSVEAQLLGLGEETPGRTTGNVCTPGTHVMIGGVLETTHCINSEVLAAPPGEWVYFEADVRGEEFVRLYINGELAFELTEPQIDPTDQWASNYDLTAVSLSQGYIALQAESHGVEFRNIQLLDRDPVD